MSFATSFDGMVQDFCRVLSEKYHLKEDEVLSVWTGSISQPMTTPMKSSSSAAASSVSKSVPVPDDADTEITKEKIMTATKDMLAAMCKKKGLKQSGKKEDLFKRLVDSLSSTVSTAESTTTKKPVASGKKEDTPIIKTIKERTAELAIRKNKFGNFEHVPTGLIFNTDKIVYGKQLVDGAVLELTSIDIDTCNKYKFPFKMPENLNTSNKNMDDVKIEDMEDELLDEEDIEEDIEEDVEEDEDDA